MKGCSVTVSGISPYSQGRYHGTEKLDRETDPDYEERTWRERLHVNKDGYVFIPPMAFKNMMSEVAKYLGIQIPGKGKSNYTKHFEAGIMVVEPMVLDIKKDDVGAQWLFVPSDGRRGGTKRVPKCFPIIHTWGGVVEFQILDDIITEDVFEIHLRAAGKYIGIGRSRPRNNGYFGRFEVTAIKWDKT